MLSGNELTRPRQPASDYCSYQSNAGAAGWKNNTEGSSPHLTVRDCTLFLPLGGWEGEEMLLTWQQPLTYTPHIHFADHLQHTFKFECIPIDPFLPSGILS